MDHFITAVAHRIIAATTPNSLYIEVPMRIRTATVLFLSVSGLLIASWTATARQTRRIDDAALRNSGKTGEESLTYGLTPGETRYSPLKQIDVSNVSHLGLAWSY